MTCGRCGADSAPFSDTCRKCGAVLTSNSARPGGPAEPPATRETGTGPICWYVNALKRYAVFTGRARRKEFWYFFLFNNLILIALTILSSLFGSANGPSLFSVLAAMYAIGTMVPALAVSARRLHDTGRTAWWVLIALAPLVGAIILLVFYAEDSKTGRNQYGPIPKSESDSSTLNPVSPAETVAGEPSTVAAALMPPPDASRATLDELNSHAGISSQPQAGEPRPAPMIFCTKCGASNPAEAKYCYSCGSLIFNPQHADTPKEEQSTEPATRPKNGPNAPGEQTRAPREASTATEVPSNKVIVGVFLAFVAAMALVIVLALYSSGNPSGVSSSENQPSNASTDISGPAAGSSSTANHGNLQTGTDHKTATRVHTPICPSGVSSDNPMVPVAKGKISLTNANTGQLYYGAFPLNFRISNQTSYCIAIIEVRAVLQVEAPKPSVSLKLKTNLSPLLKPGSEEDAKVMIDAYKDQNGNDINDPYIVGGLQKLDVVGVWGFRPVGR